MKLTPRKYAQALAAALETASAPKATIVNFLELLRRRKQFKLLPKILQTFEAQWAARRNVLKLDVKCPSKFKDAVDDFLKTLGAKLGKTTDSALKLSDSLIGGLEVRMGDTLIDASIESRLKLLQNKLRTC